MFPPRFRRLEGSVWRLDQASGIFYTVWLVLGIHDGADSVPVEKRTGEQQACILRRFVIGFRSNYNINRRPAPHFRAPPERQAQVRTNLLGMESLGIHPTLLPLTYQDQQTRTFAVFV